MIYVGICLVSDDDEAGGVCEDDDEGSHLCSHSVV